MGGTEHVLCRLEEIAVGGSKGVLPDARGRPRGFLVRQADRVTGYVNICPHHDRAPLEWKTDAFLNGAGDHIQCASHGALFRIEDGYCVIGPCTGQSLRPLAIRVEDGQVLARIEDDADPRGMDGTRQTALSETREP